MKYISKRVLVAAAFIVGSMGPVWGQQYPTRAITMVVPTGPSGVVDILARYVATKLEPTMGQIVVENRAGAGTYVGASYVARSNPDGHTLLINSTVGLFGDLFTKGLDVMTDELVTVANVAESPYVFHSPAAVPAKDLKEFVTYVRGNPGKLNITNIPGTAHLLETILFLKDQKLDMVGIPYNSAQAVRTAMLRNEVHLYFSASTSLLSSFKDGTITPLAVASRKRDPQLPNVPTTFELGINFEGGPVQAILAPKRTPQAIINRWNRAVIALLETQEVRDAYQKFALLIPPPATSAELTAKMSAWAKALRATAKEMGIEPQ